MVHSDFSDSADGSGGSESFDNLVIQAPQSMREDYIQNAVNFLSHPKVKGSPVFHRRSFLEKKGLTNEEIDEAFRRVPDPKPNSADAAAAGSQQANNHNQSVALQPYTEVQPQAATGSVTAARIAPHTKVQFSWVNTLLGAGLFLGFGASAAITVKKWFIPSLKSWTRRVVSEGDENDKDELTSKLYEEIREAIKVSASAYSDIARINQEVLSSKDEDRKVLMKLTEAFEAQANMFKSFSETLNHIRANQFSQYNILEEHVQPAPWNGPMDYQGRASQQTNMYAAPLNGSFDPGRHSFIPVPAEPTYGSYSGSYTEQRVQRSGYGFQPQLSNDRQNLGLRGNYQGVSSNHQASNAIIDDPAAVAAEFQRRWVPPQPPGVIMPEAATAIRQPRSVPRQQSQPADGRLSPDVPRPSEPAVATTEQMNGVPGAPDGELASDGGTVTANAGSSGGSEEQQQEAT
ncbi:Peroxisomal membrane protein PEX14 [Dichanthelium oligosanthes]|uniref:Peroxisomal membrane protein PEX14 n=1 Tax=Dichanthelium oligosanthes TaxID=888268 RepID=A0A1E5VJK0_9POAL|nr:Peroxisomal membrane protein PEX14 [Dichanthelium oligosanthes]